MPSPKNHGQFVGIKGDIVILNDGKNFFLAECWSATLRGAVKTYKRSGVSYAREVSSRDQAFAIDPKYVEAAQWMLCCERSDNAFVNYATMDDLLAALEKEAAKRTHPLSG